MEDCDCDKERVELSEWVKFEACAMSPRNGWDTEMEMGRDHSTVFVAPRKGWAEKGTTNTCSVFNSLWHWVQDSELSAVLMCGGEK